MWSKQFWECVCIISIQHHRQIHCQSYSSKPDEHKRVQVIVCCWRTFRMPSFVSSLLSVLQLKSTEGLSSVCSVNLWALPIAGHWGNRSSGFKQLTQEGMHPSTIVCCMLCLCMYLVPNTVSKCTFYMCSYVASWFLCTSLMYLVQHSVCIWTLCMSSYVARWYLYKLCYPTLKVFHHHCVNVEWCHPIGCPISTHNLCECINSPCVRWKWGAPTWSKLL